MSGALGHSPIKAAVACVYRQMVSRTGSADILGRVLRDETMQGGDAGIHRRSSSQKDGNKEEEREVNSTCRTWNGYSCYNILPPPMAPIEGGGRGMQPPFGGRSCRTPTWLMWRRTLGVCGTAQDTGLTCCNAHTTRLGSHALCREQRTARQPLTIAQEGRDWGASFSDALGGGGRAAACHGAWRGEDGPGSWPGARPICVWAGRCGRLLTLTAQLERTDELRGAGMGGWMGVGVPCGLVTGWRGLASICARSSTVVDNKERELHMGCPPRMPAWGARLVWREGLG